MAFYIFTTLVGTLPETAPAETEAIFAKYEIIKNKQNSVLESIFTPHPSLPVLTTE